MDLKLPRILSPHLGCPSIVSLPQWPDSFEVVIAEPMSADEGVYNLLATPSFPGDGQEFNLILGQSRELTDISLPPAFDRVEQTRWHISTTLRVSLFQGQARFRVFSARPDIELTSRHLRTVAGHPRLTLYDLVLRRGAEAIFTVYHALALRPPDGAVRFIHATDLHVARRNDLYDAALKTSANPDDAAPTIPFVNFNQKLRLFIEHANDLADQGRLDFVLLLGDLVDFVKHRYSDQDDCRDNNWRLLADILLGTEGQGIQAATRPGIKVPVFTCPGNHDWRFFPYTPPANAAAYGLNRKTAKLLDPFWADDPEELVLKTKQCYEKMLREGALLSNVMLGGRYLHKVGDWLRNVRDKFMAPTGSDKVRGNILDWLLPRLNTWKMQVLVPLLTSILTGASGLLPFLSRFGEWSVEKLIIGFALFSGLINGGIVFAKFMVRWRSPDIMALEAGWEGLTDYFLNFNPYYNYAFSIGRNYFLILDTGYDCLRAQRFWDGGRKKLGPVSIRDNLLGGSPDSMAFFEANGFYAYSQIVWLERLLRLISDREGKADTPPHIFIGIHSPPLNLSRKQRHKADLHLAGKGEILLEAGKYNLRYGTVNHYLSQFLHLCLGRVEGNPGARLHPVTMVLAGHAHWKLECRLHWDEQRQRPLVYYGDYTGVPGALQEKPWPLVLQTPAIGPVGVDEFSLSPPHFRWLEITQSGAVHDARVTNPPTQETAGPDGSM